MTLTSSGQIKMSEINTELGRTSTTSDTTLKSLSDGTHATINTANASSDRPDGNAPHAMSEFYSYDHSATSLTFSSFVAGDDAGTPFEDQEAACSGELTNATFYHSGTGSTPVNGDRVFTAQNASNPADDGWYAIAVSRTQRDVYEVYNGDGSVRNKTTCE